MKHSLLAIFLLLFTSYTLMAQDNYAPAYKQAMATGDKLFKQKKYQEARTYYVKARDVKNGGNPEAAQKKINECDAKIAEQRRAAEEEAARRRTEAERAQREAEEKQRSETERNNRASGYMKRSSLSLQFASMDWQGNTLVDYGQRLTDLKMDRLHIRMKYESIDRKSHNITLTTKLKYDGKTKEKEESVTVNANGGNIYFAYRTGLDVGSYVYEVWFEGKQLCSKSFTVEKEEVRLSVNGNSSGETYIGLPSTAGTSEISVSTNALDFEVIPPYWCSLRSKSANGFELSFDANKNLEERRGDCKVKSGGKTIIVHLTQNGSNPSVIVDGKSSGFNKTVGMNGGVVRMPVSSNTKWRVSNVPSNKWLTVSYTMNDIALNVKKNTKKKSRSACFDVLSQNASGVWGKQMQLCVVQDPKTHVSKTRHHRSRSHRSYIDDPGIWFTLDAALGAPKGNWQGVVTLGHRPTDFFGYYVQGSTNFTKYFYDVQAGITLGSRVFFKLGAGYRHISPYGYYGWTYPGNIDYTLGFVWPLFDYDGFALNVDLTLVKPIGGTMKENGGFVFSFGIGWVFPN